MSDDFSIEKRIAQLMRQAASAPSSYDLRERTEYADARVELDRLLRVTELCQTLWHFTDEASTVAWASRQEYAEKLKLVWYHELQRLFALSERPRDAAACTERCRDSFSIVTISGQLELYGCALHGTLHDCSVRQQWAQRRLVQRERVCPCTRVAPNHDVVCVFSGAVVGKRTTSVTIGSKDYDNDSGSHGHAQPVRYLYAMSLRETNEMCDSFENTDALKTAKRTAADAPPPPHFAVKAVGRSRRLRLTDSQRALFGSDFVAQQRSAQIIRDAERRARGVCETVVEDVLYDEELRELLYMREMLMVEEKAVADVLSYHAECKREKRMPVYTLCFSVFLNSMHGITMLPIVKRDPAFLTRFAARVETLWGICHRSPAVLTGATKSSSLKQFALAMLYRMQKGFHFLHEELSEAVVIMPADAALVLELPSEDLLVFFGATQRENLRERIYSSQKLARQHRGAFGKRSASSSGGDADSGGRSKRARRSQSGSGPSFARRIDVPGLPTMTERDVTPWHLLDEALGNDGSYKSSDVTAGQSFASMCLRSFDAANLIAISNILKETA